MITIRKNRNYFFIGKYIVGFSSLMLVVIMGSFLIDFKDKSFKFSAPTIKDSLAPTAKAKNSIWLETGNYMVQYIGKRQDTIQLEYFSRNLDDYSAKHGGITSTGFKIMVDTSQIISSYSIFKGEKNIYKAYPVYVINTSGETLKIGYGWHLPMKLEALDSSGTWRPIEERFIYMCGTGLNRIILPPNEIAITSTPVYTGRFKTQLRISFNDTPSHPFYGSINLTQFDSEFYVNGERKPEPLTN